MGIDAGDPMNVLDAPPSMDPYMFVPDRSESWRLVDTYASVFTVSRGPIGFKGCKHASCPGYSQGEFGVPSRDRSGYCWWGSGQLLK